MHGSRCVVKLVSRVSEDGSEIDWFSHYPILHRLMTKDVTPDVYCDQRVYIML